MSKELITFPFKPFLAKYLFHSLKSDIYELDGKCIRYLDIDLRSIDGFIIRMMLTKHNGPVLKSSIKGYRLAIGINKYPGSKYLSLQADARNCGIEMTEEAAAKLIEYYTVRFLEHFDSFVSGYVLGTNKKRGALQNAIHLFLDKYDIQEEDGVTLAKLQKYYRRTQSTLKEPIYEMHKESIASKENVIKSKSMIQRYSKTTK